MAKKTYFNLPIEEFRRQTKSNGHDCDHDRGPIRRGETIEPCIKGAKKISEDPEIKSLVKEVLTHQKE